MPKILVEFRRGVATIKPTGFAGDTCLKATAKVSAALGKKSLSQVTTDEMYLERELDVEAGR
jgi:hypothetical protein